MTAFKLNHKKTIDFENQNPTLKINVQSSPLFHGKTTNGIYKEEGVALIIYCLIT